MKRLRTLLIALMTASLVAPLAIGCGGEDPDHQAENQDNNDEEEVEEGPTHVLVDFSPARYAYDVGTSITPQATIYDGAWEQVGAYVEWSASPASAVEQNGDSWTLVEEADITFEACVLIDDEVTTTCGERTIPAVRGNNLVVIDSPTPGEHLNAVDHEYIEVSGYVDDYLGADNVQINGQVVSVDGDGRFSHQLTPEFGVNTIFVRAFDGLSSADKVAALSVMWAPAYLEPEIGDGHIGSSINDAILLALGQNFLDDGEPYTEISESQIVTKDLADILRLVLDHVDILSQIPNPVVDTSSLVLSVPDITINDPIVELDATDSGLALFGQIQDLQAETAGFLELSDKTVDLDGSISATVSLHASLDAYKSSVDDPFHVELVDFELAVEDATPDFESEEANAIFALADSVLRDQLEQIILDGLDLSFIDALPDMLLDIFESLDEIIAGQTFELDLDIGDPLELSFNGEVDEFTPVLGQGFKGSVSADIGVQADATYPDNPGIALLQPDQKQSPLFQESRVQIGLNLTLLNAIFHNLWNAGLLDLNITDLVPDGVSGLIDEGHATGMLPPVVVPPTGDSPHDILLRLGQLEIDLDWLDQNDRFGAEVIVGADLSVVGQEISIDVSDEPEINLWLIESSENEPFMSPDELRDIISSALWPEIEGAIADGLSFALPIPELDALEAYAPALTEMLLDVRLNRAVDIREGFLMIDATLEGELFLD